MSTSMHSIVHTESVSTDVTKYFDPSSCSKTPDRTNSYDYKSAMSHNCHAESLQANNESSVESAGSIVSLVKSIVVDSTVGNYTLIKTIGNGGYATVKLAKHLLTGEEVAIKIIDKSPLSANRVEKLYREIRIMKMLNHPNIVQLFEVIDTEKTLYLVMEYVSGGDLFDYCFRCGKLNEQNARTMFRQIVSAVEYCHYKRVVHRDLKVENVLLDNNMNIKITDFGLSNEFSPGDKLNSFCGTRQYIAPEIFLEQKYGPEVDVWSLGVILYITLTGRYPFGDSSWEQIKWNVLTCIYKTPHNMSKDCENLLKKIFVLSPEKRATLETIMKDKWVNKGYKKGELKPYAKQKQTMSNPKGNYCSWTAHILRSCNAFFGFSRRDVKNPLHS